MCQGLWTDGTSQVTVSSTTFSLSNYKLAHLHFTVREAPMASASWKLLAEF